MSAEEIIQGLAEEQGWNETSKATILTQFIDKLGEDDPKVLEKLNIFLVDIQNTENEVYSSGPPTISDELHQFLDNIVKEGKEATISDAQEVLRQTSPEKLGQLIEQLLLEDNGVESLDELDLESVYDDVAKELDWLEDEYGLTKPLTYFLAPPE